jgi:hypothetical protein
MKTALLSVVVLWTLQGAGLFDVGVWLVAVLGIARLWTWRVRT